MKCAKPPQFFVMLKSEPTRFRYLAALVLAIGTVALRRPVAGARGSIRFMGTLRNVVARRIGNVVAARREFAGQSCRSSNGYTSRRGTRRAASRCCRRFASLCTTASCRWRLGRSSDDRRTTANLLRHTTLRSVARAVLLSAQLGPLWPSGPTNAGIRIGSFGLHRAAAVRTTFAVRDAICSTAVRGLRSVCGRTRTSAARASDGRSTMH